MKILTALLQHETNTFSSLPTPYEAFAGMTGLSSPPVGDEAVSVYGRTDTAFAAFLELGKKEGADVVIPIAAYAEPSGPVADQTFERIADRICEAVAGGCDVVMLDLHGAMVTESIDDGEGELLRRIRRITPDIPIAVALDFHANITSKVARKHRFRTPRPEEHRYSGRAWGMGQGVVPPRRPVSRTGPTLSPLVPRWTDRGPVSSALSSRPKLIVCDEFVSFHEKSISTGFKT